MILICLTLFVGADRPATTRDGLQVVLHDNGTWEAMSSAEAPPPPSGQVATEPTSDSYDKFSDETKIMTRSVGIADVKGLSVVAMYWHKGTKHKRPSTVTLLFSWGGRDWRYLHGHDLTIMADGKRILVKTSRQGDVDDGYVYESVIGDVSLENLRRMAKAKSLEAKLFADEFSLLNAQPAIQGILAAAERAN